jgi:hypothetical protein
LPAGRVSCWGFLTSCGPLYGRRAGRLSPQARAWLEAAAVAGLEVDAGLLASVRPEGRPADLVAVGLLDADDDGFRFRHPLLQEAAYHEVPAERRRALHERIASAMAKSGSHSAEHVAAHLERAGRPDAALSVLDTAAGKRAGPGKPDARRPFAWARSSWPAGTSRWPVGEPAWRMRRSGTCSGPAGGRNSSRWFTAHGPGAVRCLRLSGAARWCVQRVLVQDRIDCPGVHGGQRRTGQP